MSKRRVKAETLVSDPEETSEFLKWADPPKEKEEDAETSLEVFDQEEGANILAEGEEIEAALTKDVYSLLYTADLCSWTTVYALVNIFIQGGILFVLLFDLIDTSKNPKKTNDESNRLNIPAEVEPTVTFAQFLAMMLTVLVVAAHGDVLIGISRLVEGYDEGIKYDMPNATCSRWFFIGVLQTLVGIALLLDSSILFMQSTTVFEVALNLTALFFLQALDQIAFLLGSMGILSKQLAKDCEQVQNLMQVTPLDFRRRRNGWKSALLVMISAALVIFYAIVVSWQVKGDFLCKNVYIQFGDAYYPEWAYYSGVFQSEGSLDSRTTYIDKKKTRRLAYCSAEQAWTIALRNDDQCNYVFKSTTTTTFDVMEVAGATWNVKTKNIGDVPVDWIKLVCNDCSGDNCKNNDEMCPAGRVGLNCEFQPDCDWFHVDFRTRDSLPSIAEGSFFITNEFTSLSYDYTFYDRFIYVPISSDVFDPDNSDPDYVLKQDLFAFIVFTGRRWVVFSISQGEQPTLTIESLDSFMRENDPVNKPVDTLQNMTNTFKFSPLFFSSPLNHGEESSEVTWVRSALDNSTLVSRRPDDSQPTGAKLLCSDCQTAGCQNEGRCEGGFCVCSAFYEGYQCERALDCTDTDENCFNEGTCNTRTKLCECKDESFGNLCQYPSNFLEDPYYCGRCDKGSCRTVFDQECICKPGFIGEFCNEDNSTSVELVETDAQNTTTIVNGTMPNTTTTNTTTEGTGIASANMTVEAPTVTTAPGSAVDATSNNATGSGPG